VYAASVSAVARWLIQADDLERRRLELGKSPTPHPGVELQMDADVWGDLVR